MQKHILLSAALLLAFFISTAQVQVDKKIELTGSGSNAKVEGVDEVANNHDAANKIYVDTAIANRTGGGGGASHYIGELFGGGIVYYIYKDNTGTEHGFIASPVDISAGSTWSNLSSSTIGVTAQSTWDGQANTNAIISQPGHTNSAAQLCVNYNGGGFTDWFLPSTDQLLTLFYARLIINKVLPPADGLAIAIYWTSTESLYDTGAAFFVNFTYGTPTSADPSKGGSYRVRAIRAF